MRRRTAVLLTLAVFATACGSVSDPSAPTRSFLTFTYGFDLSTQEPDSANRVPANVPSSVASARRVFGSLPGLFVDQPLWGFGIRHSPEPSPGVFDWSDLAARIALIQSAGDVPVITLVSAPNWMKDHTGGNQNLFNSPPTPDHYKDFATLAAHVAQRFPQVRYFVVWSELRGFWNPRTRSWDYRDYTTMYNDVYRAIKRVRPDAQVGGPYADMYSEPKPIRGVVSRVHGPWGYLDQGMLDAISYWLKHKAGADFIAVDGPTEIAQTGNARLTDPVTAAEQYAAVDRWIRTQTNLPIWWMESHIQPPNGWTRAQATAARIVTLAEMASSGARVGMQWQPQEQQGWPDEGLWTSTRIPGGGQPTQLAKVLPRVLPILEHAPVLTPSEPRGVLVASDASGILAVNTTNRSVQAIVRGKHLALRPGQVAVR